MEHKEQVQEETRKKAVIALRNNRGGL